MERYLFPLTGIKVHTVMIAGKDCCSTKCRFLQVDKVWGKDYCCFYTKWIKKYTVWADPIRLPKCVADTEDNEKYKER